MNNRPLNVLSLFDGMSCGQLALNRAGVKYNTYYASEVDKNAIKITQTNYPNTVQLGSVQSISASQLEPIDLLIGGSPCQGFSRAGKMDSFNDPRSQLFFEYVRLLKECNPKYFLLENVTMKKEDQAVITNLLGVEPILINSALVSAQNRKRLYWTNIPYKGLPQDKNVMLASVLESNPLSKHNLSNAAVARIQRTKWFKPWCTAATPKIRTLIAGYAKIHGGAYYIDNGTNKRKITPLEAERLQTVPDNYTACVADTHRYHTLGNGWTVDVIAHIFCGLPITTNE